MKGIFPKMSIPDIINSLAGWDMPVSQEQLIRPSPDFVQTVYCACLQQITSISHESLSEQIKSALAVLEDPSPVRFIFLTFICTCIHFWSSGLVRLRVGSQFHSLPSVRQSLCEPY
jgi:hypothetical protein